MNLEQILLHIPAALISISLAFAINVLILVAAISNDENILGQTDFYGNVKKMSEGTRNEMTTLCIGYGSVSIVMFICSLIMIPINSGRSNKFTPLAIINNILSLIFVIAFTPLLLNISMCSLTKMILVAKFLGETCLFMYTSSIVCLIATIIIPILWITALICDVHYANRTHNELVNEN